MNDTENFNPHPEYQLQSEAVKATISPKQYAWMDDESRRNLERDLTNPEVGED